MSQQSLEERVAALESKIAGYETERAQMRSLEGLRAGQMELRALFAGHQEYVNNRLDTFESHITVRLDVVEDNLTARLDTVTARLDVVEDNLTARLDTVETAGKEHKAAIESLAAQVQGLAVGQQQIIEILSGGKPKRQD